MVKTIKFGMSGCIAEYEDGSLFRVVNGVEVPCSAQEKAQLTARERQRNAARIANLRLALNSATRPERIASLTEELERRCAVRLPPAV